MKISLYREIKKRGPHIFEVFSFLPKNKIVIDEHRRVFDFLNLLSLYFSIGEQYSLIERKTFEYSISSIYCYNPKAKIPKPSFIYEFDYIPFMGKRKCSKCIYSKKQNHIQYCEGRMKKIENDFWKDCLYWKEDSFIKVLKHPWEISAWQ